jgi:hypothetical protein
VTASAGDHPGRGDTGDGGQGNNRPPGLQQIVVHREQQAQNQRQPTN